MKHNAKLDNDQRKFVFRMYAEGYGYAEIVREVKQQFDIKMHADSIRDTCKAPANQTFVKAFREEYLAEVRSVPIANKRVRIDDLQKERTRIKGMIDKNPLKTKSDKSEYLSMCGELRRLTDVAREEMERKPQLIQQAVMSFGHKTDEQLFDREQELARKYGHLIREGDRTTRIGPDSGGEEPEGPT